MRGIKKGILCALLLGCVLFDAFSVSAEEEENNEMGEPALLATYTSGSLGPAGTIHLANDQNQPVTSWSEGILGVNGTPAFCINPLVDFATGTCTAVDALAYGIPQTYITMCGMVEPLTASACSGMSQAQKYLMQQTIIWRILNECYHWNCGNIHIDPSVLSIETQSAILDSVWERLHSSERDTYFGTGTVYVHGSSQALAIFQVRKRRGKGTLVKESANSGITDHNNCYTLKGAKYGVYSDAACTGKQGELTVTENGTSNTLELDIGTYYIKELTAPSGYALDKNVYPITIRENETTTLKVKDQPQHNPLTLLLKKVDSETGESAPQGSASLKDAEFTIKYYPIYSESDPAIEGHTPNRTWILKTDEEGNCLLNPDYQVSGDDFYQTADGEITLPLGTVTIQETKPSEGYLINEEVFVRQVKPTGNAERLDVFVRPEVSEEIIRGDLALAKYQENIAVDSEIKHPLAGIEFTITSKTTGEQVMTLVTDEQGKATTRQPGVEKGALVYDTYLISEVAETVPEGIKPIGDFEVVLSEPDCFLFYILEDKNVISPLTIIKVDSSTGETIAVADTEFRLLDENQEVITFTTHYPHEIVHDTFFTDENGQFTFPKKLDYGRYYLEEVQAPEGYLKGELLPFTIDEWHDWDEPLMLTYEDDNVKGKIRIEKIDQETKELLDGAEFEIRAAEDIYTPDGTLRVEKGALMDTLTTTEGKAQSKELYLGNYVVKETKQPRGYQPSDKSYPVSLTYLDQETAIVYGDLTIENQPFKSEAPKTGDDLSLLIWMGLIVVLSGAMVGGYLLLRRR